jgi:hypothetical protein
VEATETQTDAVASRKPFPSETKGPDMRRRHLLQRLGTGLAGATSVAIAGCAQDDSPADPDTDAPMETDDPTPTDSAVPTRTPAGPERYTRRGRGDGVALVTDPDAVFHAEGDEVRALVGDGEVGWTADGAAEGDVTGAALTVDGESLVVSWTGETRVYATGDGTERWRADTGCVGPPATVGDTVVLADRQGRVVGRALERDDERWVGELGATPTGVVGVDGAAVVATRGPGDSALVRALTPSDGRERWRVHPGYEVTTAPVAFGGVAVVGTLHPGHELGDDAATTSPTDGAADGALVGCADGSEAWATGLDGRPVRLGASSSDGVFVLHDAFVFEELSRRPHLSVVGVDGIGWTRRPVPTAVDPVVTKGAIALSGTLPSGDATTLAREQVTGHPIWRQSDSVDTAAAAGDAFAVVDEPRVRLLGALGGRERWTA